MPNRAPMASTSAFVMVANVGVELKGVSWS